MSGFLITLVAVFIISEAKYINNKECYDPKQDFYPYLSTRTAYQFVRGNISRPSTDCEPVQIWMMSRHGARHPAANVVERVLSIGDIRDQIVKNHERGVGELCTDDLNKLRQWQLDSGVSIKSADTLAPQGKKDLRMLAQRLQSSFPELFESNNSDDYLFTSTIKPSASDSLKIFASELVGTKKGLNLEVPRTNDTILLAHANCPTWINEFIANRVYAERDAFTVGPEIRKFLTDFSGRLGFANTLNFSTVRLIYEVCRLETAWNPEKPSTWCTLFTKDELIVMEYREDLDYYYCCGPGNKMNPKLNCPSVKDMFQHFEQIENGYTEDQPKGVFYFGHTTNIQSLMSALHIAQEPSPLLASNFETSKNRIYRASLVGPFSANFIAVLYKCAHSKSPYKVMFFLNENLVRMEGCDDGVCDLQFLKDKYGPEIKSCSLDFCYEGLTKDQLVDVSVFEKQLTDLDFDRTGSATSSVFFNGSEIFNGSHNLNSGANRQTNSLMILISLILVYIIKYFL